MVKNGKMIELQRLRERYGISRRAVAIMLNCTEQTVWRWEAHRVEDVRNVDLERRLNFLIETLQKKEMKDERRNNG